MANIAAQRIKREFKEVIRSEEVAKCAIKVELVGDSFTELRGEIGGPPDTPYEGGVFNLEIKIPETYPFTPPKVRFVSKIWHPNISSVTGAICLDILKDQCCRLGSIVSGGTKTSICEKNAFDHFYHQPDDLFCSCSRSTTREKKCQFHIKRAAAMTLRTVLLSLQALMASPEPDDPQDAVVAKQYKDSLETFKLTARYWTSTYAGGPRADEECSRKVQRLMDMGVDKERACVALSTFDWNIERATEQLFS